MLRKFEVKNFKNFKENICIDFTNVHDYKYNEYCVRNNLINKMIIYGKNAVGKSNLGIALFDISMDVQLTRNPYVYRNDQKLYKNADALEDDLVEFLYSFQLDNDVVDYLYKKKDVSSIVYEKLIINGKIIFSYDLVSNESNFDNVGDINAAELNWKEFFDTLYEKKEDTDSTQPTALRYIIYNTIQKDDSVIYKLSQFIKGMRLTSTSSNLMPFRGYYADYFDKPENLSKFEKFLNDCDVKCKLIVLEQPGGKKDLYFDHAKPLHFNSNLSSGTAALTRFYFQYLSSNRPSFVFMDEFDAYYHYELSEKIIDLLENEFECQVILTSHNTNLLSNSIMRPDCFMILGNGKLTPICEATHRELRQGHNLEKLYMNGEFDG